MGHLNAGCGLTDGLISGNGIPVMNKNNVTIYGHSN